MKRLSPPLIWCAKGCRTISGPYPGSFIRKGRDGPATGPDTGACGRARKPATGLWRRANFETGAAKDASLRKGIDEFRQATVLYPSSSAAFWQYGDALRKLGNYLEQTGREAEGKQRRSEAREAFRRSEELAVLKKT